MSALYDRMAAADDAQEFAHDHAAEICREMLLVEQVVTRWENTTVQRSGIIDETVVVTMKACASEIRAAMP